MPRTDRHEHGANGDALDTRPTRRHYDHRRSESSGTGSRERERQRPTAIVGRSPPGTNQLLPAACRNEYPRTHLVQRIPATPHLRAQMIHVRSGIGVQLIGQYQPRPRVRVFPTLAFFSRNSMIMPATFLPVAFSMPSRPGEELTSITTGP